MVNKSESVFIIIFVAEACIKMLGMGFAFSSGCYLRNSWNCFDFLVAVTSLLSVIPSMQNFSVLRTFRLLRPLKSLKGFSSMRLLIETLLTSM